MNQVTSSENPIITTRSSLRIPFLPILITIVFCLFFPDYFYLTIPLLLLPIFGAFMSIFTVYECHESYFQTRAPLYSKKIPYSDIRYIKKESNHLFAYLWMGWPKTKYHLRFNSYDDLFLYPEDKDFIQILEKKIHDTAHSKNNSEI